MNEQEKRNITLHIYDTDVTIRILPEQEEEYRLAGKLINERLNAYFQAFKGKKDDKEITFFAMIDIALKCVKAERRNDVSPYDNILKELTSEIAEVLK